MKDHLYTVTKLNSEIKAILEGNPSFRNIFVQGEISNYKAHASGHHYLTLKDDGAAINAVMFRTDAMHLRFRMENGMHVIARGRISSFPKTGQVQMYLADMMPDGMGALHLAFEQTKNKLYAEGLFAEERKRSLPAFPQNIALITSPTGAAVQDMIRILGRRWPLAQVELFPALVQGSDAPADLCRALTQANTVGRADIIIIGRGGGSLEDLWAFNEECVARSIAASVIPVISAVGHEPDITIADFVADMRAPTPSAAAELAVPNYVEIVAQIRRMEAAQQIALHNTVQRCKQMSVHLQKRLLLRTPQHQVAERRLILEHMTERLLLKNPQYQIGLMKKQNSDILHKMHILALKNKDVKQSSLSEFIAALDALSPLKVLSRGYAAVLDKAGNAVRNSATLQIGDVLDIRLAQGAVTCNVLSTRRTYEKETNV